MIEIRCCHDLAEAAPFRDAINALNLASARPDPFSTFEYYENHVRSAAHILPPANPRLWLLLAFSAGELTGYAALKQGRQRVLGLRAMKLDWLTAHIADRPHLVARPAQAAAVGAAIYAYLLACKREWSLLEFQQQEAASPLLPAPVDATSGACRSRDWPSLPNGTITLRWSSLAGYFAALPKKSRSNISRQMRTLLAAGDVQLLTASEPSARAALFELYRGVEAHSWKAQTAAGLGGEHRWLGYYTGLLDPRQPMQLVIQVLLLDGAPIAGLICGAFDRGLYALHMAYDDRTARLAPGSALLLMGVRMAIEGGYEFLNLLRGSGYYKTRWLADMTETRSLQVYRAGSAFHWRRVLGDAARRWFGRASDAGTLFNAVRREIDDRTEPDGAAAAWLPGPGERARYASVIAHARRGSGEFLSATQLAAVLPFAAHRAEPAPASLCAVTSG
jgi:hypothetical protein